MIYLKIGKKPLPFAFGMAGIRRFEQATGKPIGSLFSIFQGDGSGEIDLSNVMFSDLLLVLSCGLETGARKDGIPKNYDVEAVADMIDESGNMTEIITAAMQELAESLSALNSTADAPQEGKKKTATAQKPTARRG